MPIDPVRSFPYGSIPTAPNMRLDISTYDGVHPYPYRPVYVATFRVPCPLCGREYETERLDDDHCGSAECRLEWKRRLGRDRSRRYRERYRGS
jgi:hypothetical protein